MSLYSVDRNVKIMKETCGTTTLITDYQPTSQKVIQEVMYDLEVNVDKSKKQDLFEVSDDDLTYGIEPTYKIEKNQRVLTDWYNQQNK